MWLMLNMRKLILKRIKYLINKNASTLSQTGFNALSGHILEKTMSEQDLYQTLGIEKNSSDADIKKAYRKFAMKYHPDRNPGDSASEQKFKSIQKAYAILSDKQKRAAYDKFGHAGVNPQGGMGGGFNPGDAFNDIFGDVFGDILGGGRKPEGLQ